MVDFSQLLEQRQQRHQGDDGFNYIPSPPKEDNSLRGTLDRIIFERDGFIIAALETKETILGNLFGAIIGQEYEFTGAWVTDSRFGRQFKFDTYRTVTPQDLDGIRRYIIRAKWLGPVLARKVVQEFGEDTLSILKNDPDKVAGTTPGITPAKAQEIAETLKSQEQNEAATVELETLLGGQHLPKQTIPTLIARYGSDAPARVKANPYSLIQLRGIGFLTADRVALSHSIGYEREGVERQKAAILYELQDAADSGGHTLLPRNVFEERVKARIGLLPGEEAIGQLEEEERIILTADTVALTNLYQDEQDVAGIIRQFLSTQDDLSKHITVDLKGLAPDQVEAFTLAMRYPIFILTGAPGTGKTYTLQRIIEQFRAWGRKISLAAPTGKAAKRMSELIDRPASTIHRLLGPEPYQDGNETKFSFSYGEGRPLPDDVVVIDEFSMVDISLAASLFRAIVPSTRLLIVGDHYQLPSVGPGAVLRDLLAAGIPSYELTEIKRNTGDIVKACHAIKDGRPAVPSPTLNLDNGFNFRHIQESDPAKIQEIIKDIVTHRLPQRGYDPMWDVQCLSPVNDRGELSCKALNELLQNALNPYFPIKGEANYASKSPFRPRDKVIQRKNQDIDGEFIVNGDLGEIAAITGHEIVVNFKFPDRRVCVKRNENHLTLAYCITIHKAQGSEAPVIIIPLHSSFGIFPNRELIYTAISRAQDICITVGQWGYLEQAVKRVGNVKRITRLTELLK